MCNSEAACCPTTNTRSSLSRVCCGARHPADLQHPPPCSALGLRNGRAVAFAGTGLPADNAELNAVYGPLSTVLLALLQSFPVVRMLQVGGQDERATIRRFPEAPKKPRP